MLFSLPGARSSSAIPYPSYPKRFLPHEYKTPLESSPKLWWCPLAIYLKFVVKPYGRYILASPLPNPHFPSRLSPKKYVFMPFLGFIVTLVAKSISSFSLIYLWRLNLMMIFEEFGISEEGLTIPKSSVLLPISPLN